MAGVSTGYDQSVRSLLNKQNVDNSRIGYNPQSGTVQVDGRDFMKAPKVYQGTAYANQSGFNTAWDSFNKPAAVNAYGSTPWTPGAAQVAKTAQAAPTADTTPYTSPYQPQKNPADDQYNQMLQALLQQVQHPQQTDVNAIYASPQYAAYQAQADRGVHDAIRAAQESMGSSGFGRSSALAERSQGIQNDANTYLNTQVLPQLIAADQAAKQQALTNQFSGLDALFGQQQRYDTLGQNAESNALQRGQLTGTYVSPEMRALYDAVLKDKQNYADATTPGQRQQITSDADRLRQQIYAMGGDPSLVGADVTLGQAGANAPRFGVQTLGSREQDRLESGQNFDQGLQTRAADLNETQVMAVLTGFLPDGTPTTAQQQLELDNMWKAADEAGRIPNDLADIYGLPHDTLTQAAKVQAAQLTIDQQNANTSSFNASTSRMNAINSNENEDANTKLNQDKFKYQQDQDKLKGEEEPEPDINEYYADVYKHLDTMTPDQRKKFLTGEKSDLITRFGPSGYNQIFNSYFDDEGNPL